MPLNQGAAKASMVNWQVTAKTIYCDVIDEEVTLIIRQDWSAQCTGYSGNRDSGVAPDRLPKSKKLRRSNCEGLECRRITEYKEQLLGEEKNKT